MNPATYNSRLRATRPASRLVLGAGVDREGDFPMIEIVKNDKVVSRTRNLRGLLDYARRYDALVGTRYVAEIYAGRMDDDRGRLCVHYNDGAQCDAIFADWRVLQNWLRSRRSWHGATLVAYNGHPRGFLSATTKIA